jgi:hypothetical protein
MSTFPPSLEVIKTLPRLAQLRHALPRLTRPGHAANPKKLIEKTSPRQA